MIAFIDKRHYPVGHELQFGSKYLAAEMGFSGPGKELGCTKKAAWRDLGHASQGPDLAQMSSMFWAQKRATGGISFWAPTA
jgi:hypothetical protein